MKILALVLLLLLVGCAAQEPVDKQITMQDVKDAFNPPAPKGCPVGTLLTCDVWGRAHKEYYNCGCMRTQW